MGRLSKLPIFPPRVWISRVTSQWPEELEEATESLIQLNLDPVSRKTFKWPIGSFISKDDDDDTNEKGTKAIGLTNN